MLPRGRERRSAILTRGNEWRPSEADFEARDDRARRPGERDPLAEVLGDDAAVNQADVLFVEIAAKSVFRTEDRGELNFGLQPPP